ncbi:unnamed protein product [Choristocarpus tenellus]
MGGWEQSRPDQGTNSSKCWASERGASEKSGSLRSTGSMAIGGGSCDLCYRMEHGEAAKARKNTEQGLECGREKEYKGEVRTLEYSRQICPDEEFEAEDDREEDEKSVLRENSYYPPWTESDTFELVF